MRTTASNWIVSIFLTIVIISYYYLNINEVEDYKEQIINKYNNLIVNSIDNYLQLSINNNLNKGEDNIINFDNKIKTILKNALKNYLNIQEIFYIIIQSNNEELVINNSNQFTHTKIPEINSEEFFLIHQNSEPQIKEISVYDKEILEIRSGLQLTINQPIIIRTGIDFSKISETYQNHLINSSIITLFLLLIIILFVNYQDVILKQSIPLPENKMIISIFSKISDNSTNGVIFIDPDKRIKIFNSSAETITGIDKQSALMNDYFQVFPNDYFNVDEVFSIKKSLPLSQIEIITGTGVKKTLYYTTSLLIIDEIFTGVLISIQDITEKNAKLKIEINKEIIEANSKLGIGITKSFLNRINRIYLLFQNLLNKKIITHDLVKHSGEQVLSEVLDIEDLLNEFQKYIKVENIEYSQVGINDVFQMINNTYKEICKKKNIKMHQNYRPFLTLYTDLQKFTKIFEILIDNAIESMDDGGDIVVSVEQTLNTTTITITDTGCGLPKDIQNKLYLPFNSNKTNHKGFGLATVHKYLTLLSGEISYQTKEGLGTSFSITLPNRYDLKGKV